MGRPKKIRAPLPPIWRLSDEQWAMIEPILQRCDPPARKGPARTDPRPIMDSVIFRLSRCRGILIRWEKKAANYLGLLKLACALLWFRRYHRLTHVR
jgi:transposase